MSDKRLARSATSEPGVTLRASVKEGHSKHSPSASSYATPATGKITLLRRRRKTTNHMASTVFSTDPDPPKTPFAGISPRNSVRSHENIFGGSPEDRSDVPLPVRRSRRPVCQPKRKDTVGSLFRGVEPVSPNCRRPQDGDTYRRLFGGEPTTDSAAVNRTSAGGGGGYEDTKEKLFGHVRSPPLVRALRRPGSRSENTQEDLFGPPLPVVRNGRVQRLGDRSSFDLFKTQETGGGGRGVMSPSTAPAKDTLRSAGETKTQATKPLTGVLRSDSSVQTEETLPS